MRRDKSSRIKTDVWMAALLVPAILGVYPAMAQSDGVELVLDLSPAQGGMVTPGMGVHRFAPHTEVTITAVPQQGYRFAYWLGDVSDPTSSTTCIRMGISKAVVAVFEPDQAEALTQPEQDMIVESAGGGGGGGGGGLVCTARDLWMGGSISAGGGGRAGGQTIVWEFPPPSVPEPATLALMGVGAAILARAKGRSRPRNNGKKAKA
jgi:hypothetical protein